MQHPQPLGDQFFCLQRVTYQLGQAAIYLRQISKGLQITIYNKGLDNWLNSGYSTSYSPKSKVFCQISARCHCHICITMAFTQSY